MECSKRVLALVWGLWLDGKAALSLFFQTLQLQLQCEIDGSTVSALNVLLLHVFRPASAHGTVVGTAFHFLHRNHSSVTFLSVAGYEAPEGNGATGEKPERTVGETGEVQWAGTNTDMYAWRPLINASKRTVMKLWGHQDCSSYHFCSKLVAVLQEVSATIRKTSATSKNANLLRV